MNDDRFDAVSLGIMWDRLIGIADEAFQSLVRSSFSTIVRESYDLSCLLFDHEARAAAQARFSIAPFTGTGPATLAAMLRRFPPQTLKPGDVIVTNDPWIGTGHVNDINVARPLFRNGRLVGFTFSTTHLPDIGGIGHSAVGREVFEEGLWLPICKLFEEGRPNELLLDIIRTNVRVPEQTVGDIMANVSCCEVGGRRLVEFLDEYDLDDLKGISQAICNQSEAITRNALREIKAGTYRSELKVEGPSGPIKLACSVTIADGSAHVDFAGSDPPVPSGVNVPLCYSTAIARYSIKCVSTPHLPNNEGSVRPVRVTAPKDCILNAQPPRATSGRHAIGHFVNILIFNALAEVIPDRVYAEPGMLNTLNFQGIHPDGGKITSVYFAAGGYGAMRGLDGASTIPAPSNINGQSSEVWEETMGMTVVKRELLPDSGGAGRFRGGLGQIIVLRNDTGHPLTMFPIALRTQFPARGLQGGGDGALRRCWINGVEIDPYARHIMQPGDRLEVHEAGGGGFGDPRERDRERMLQDLAEGYITREAARDVYGFDPEGSRVAAGAS